MQKLSRYEAEKLYEQEHKNKASKKPKFSFNWFAGLFIFGWLVSIVAVLMDYGVASKVELAIMFQLSALVFYVFFNEVL